MWKRDVKTHPHYLCPINQCSVVWRRSSLFYVNYIKGKKKTTHCQFHFSQWNLRSPCLNTPWLRKPVGHTRLGPQVWRWVRNLKIKAGTPAFLLPHSPGATPLGLQLSCCIAQANFWLCHWLAVGRGDQWASASSSVKSLLHRVLSGKQRGQCVLISAQGLSLNRDSITC